MILDQRDKCEKRISRILLERNVQPVTGKRAFKQTGVKYAGKEDWTKVRSGQVNWKEE